MTDWPNRVVFGLAILGGWQLLKALPSVIFCHCGKLRIWCWYTMWRYRTQGKKASSGE